MGKIVTGHNIGGVAVPGLYEMAAEHVDVNGVEWSEGTRYTTHSAGYDNCRGCDYQDVVIDGDIVRFVREVV